MFFIPSFSHKTMGQHGTYRSGEHTKAAARGGHDTRTNRFSLFLSLSMSCTVMAIAECSGCTVDSGHPVLQINAGAMAHVSSASTMSNSLCAQRTVWRVVAWNTTSLHLLGGHIPCGLDVCSQGSRTTAIVAAGVRWTAISTETLPGAYHAYCFNGGCVVVRAQHTRKHEGWVEQGFLGQSQCIVLSYIF